MSIDTTVTDPLAAYAAQTQAAQATKTKHKTTADLDVNDFLTLMTTQLKNQDPMKPMESTQFVAQLAQFGTVSGIQSMQTSLGTLSDSLRASQTLSGTNLVGHDVLAPGTKAILGSNDTVQGALDVPTGATGVKVTISDASGQAVRSMLIDAQTGLTDFSWDGNTQAGTRAPAGAYTFAATAAVNGKTESVPTLITGRVNSVSIDATGASLTLNTSANGAVALGDVRRVL